MIDAMNAVELRRISDMVNKTRAARLRRERADAANAATAAEAHRLREVENRKLHWFTVKIPRMLDKAKQAAERGLKFSENFDDEWPDYVIVHLRGLGFEVKVSANKQWCKREGKCKYWWKVLTLRW